MNDAARASGWPTDDLEHLGRCPICGNVERALLHLGLEDRIFHTAPGRWNLWRCRACGGGYLDPRPTRESIGRAYRRYFSRSVEEQQSPSTRRDRILERLRNGYLNSRYGYALEPASRVGAVTVPVVPKVRWSASLPVRGLAKPPRRTRLLDVGFGDGSFLRFMRSAGWDVEGLEADPVAVTAARSSGLDVALGTLENGPHRPASFDAITLSHVVEHLHDPVSSLRACSRLLRRDGVLWLATPNLDSPGHRRFGENWFGLDPPRHLVLFGVAAIDHALTQAGFMALKHPRAYRAALVLAGSEALATGGDPASAWTPVSPKLRRFARLIDLATAFEPRFGEELVAVARRRD